MYPSLSLMQTNMTCSRGHRSDQGPELLPPEPWEAALAEALYRESGLGEDLESRDCDAVVGGNRRRIRSGLQLTFCLSTGPSLEGGLQISVVILATSAKFSRFAHLVYS